MREGGHTTQQLGASGLSERWERRDGEKVEVEVEVVGGISTCRSKSDATVLSDAVDASVAFLSSSLAWRSLPCQWAIVLSWARSRARSRSLSSSAPLLTATLSMASRLIVCPNLSICTS